MQTKHFLSICELIYLTVDLHHPSLEEKREKKKTSKCFEIQKNGGSRNETEEKIELDP